MSSQEQRYSEGSSVEGKEADARRRLEQARAGIEGVAAQLKLAVDAEAAAKAAAGDGREKARQALTHLNKIKDTQTRANRAAEQAKKRLADEESKSAAAKEKGKHFDDTRVEEARLDAVSAGEAASSAAIDTEKATIAYEAADKAAKEAEETLKNAAAGVLQARADEQAAKQELRVAEDGVKQAAKQAKRASKSLKKENEVAIPQPEARTADTGRSGQPVAVEALEAAIEARLKADQAIEQGRGIPGAAASGELYSGMVSIFVSRPADYGRLLRFQESLQNVKGLTVKSIGGSAVEGPKLVISLEEAVPLLDLLNKITLVDQVSQRSKARAVEVRLK